MRIRENGIYRNMTKEEEEKHLQYKESIADQAAPKTAEERIAELEEAIALLLEGAVD